MEPIGPTPPFTLPAITAGTPVMRNLRRAYGIAGARRQVLKIYNRSDAEAIIRLDNQTPVRVASLNFIEKTVPGGVAWYTVDVSVDVLANQIEIIEEDLVDQDDVEGLVG